MRRLFLSMAFCLVAATAQAATVGLQWDAVPEADGYRVYMDDQMVKPVSTTAAEITSPPGKHVFYVTAYNSWGESGPSNTVTTPAVAGIPAGVRLVITIDASQGGSR